MTDSGGSGGEGGGGAGYADARIAVDVDGNFNSTDDWAATPVMLAMMSRLKLKHELVHFSFNDSLGAAFNNAAMAEQMRQSALDGAKKFGMKKKVFFDCQTDLDAAIANLQKEIDSSSEKDPLYIIAGGPMEVLWRALSASKPESRQYVTVVSHSPRNETRVGAPEMTHTAASVRTLGVKWVEIQNQNAKLDAGSNYAPWAWLRDARQAKLRWIYERMQAAGTADVSDAGMAYFLLENDAAGTPDKLQELFGKWAKPKKGTPSAASGS